MAAQRGVTLDWVPAEVSVVHADPMRLQQCLNNLVHNALKFSPEGSRVEIQLQDEHEHVVVGVRDHGPGLDADQARRVFEPFERVHASPAGYGGTGLGLYITRMLMQAMGGAVKLQSTPGEGCLFLLKVAKASEQSG